MPSLFSRSRTHSTPQKAQTLPNNENSPYSLDEFGRVSSRASNRAFATSPTTPNKKDKKKAKSLAKNSKASIAKGDAFENDFEQHTALPDGTFLPLNLDTPKSDVAPGEQSTDHDYGFLSYGRHVILGVDQLEVLVSVLVEELETRGGVTTPFIFSTTALDISASAIKRLIRSFLNMCAASGTQNFSKAEHAWREEARFAGHHELGMCLRWGLARVIRVVGGHDVRGLISWDHYARFRDSEAALGYPPNHFESFLPELEPILQIIITRVLSLLTRLTSNSPSSGHTPPTLSPLFGPLLFGLGPATLAFHHAYIYYLRAVNATEHLLLAFIRWQDTPRLTSSSSHATGSAAALGVPIRLKEWIKGYPAMLPFLYENKNTKPQPRKGAKTVTVTSVRRNVRIYSPDLVRTAATWAYRAKSSNGVLNGLANSREWERIAPSTLKLTPRYSEQYRKRMNMPPNIHPETVPGLTTSSPTLSSAPTIGTVTPSSDKDYFGLDKKEGEDRFRSLTDLKWGEFESMGFGGLGNEKKLEFDLTESAREERKTKRQTMSWNDFSSAGFSRSDAPLNATLQFSTPVALSLSSWPSRDAELTKKMKKTEKQLPVFGWDTEPIMGKEEIIEEAFLDVFCDLIYGGGWMDLERKESLDRDCNWALVEFKSLSPSRTSVTGGSDPRTSTTLILFEEFVPLEYRQQLAIKSTTRRRLPSLFSAKKQWKQAATLNGRPYVVGHVPRSPSYREMEFEGLLEPGAATKVISLGSKASTRVVPATPTEVPRSPPPPVPPVPPIPQHYASPKIEEAYSDSTTPSTKKSSRFKLPSTMPLNPNRKSMVPAEYSAVEFQTRMASYSDGERNDNEPESAKQKRRESRDDVWVDILVASHDRRMVGQEAEVGKGNKVDPDIASMEVAQVLAAMRSQTSSPSIMSGRNDFDVTEMDAHVEDPVIDEIERVPRVPKKSTSNEENERQHRELKYDHRHEEESTAHEEEAIEEPVPEPEPEPEPVPSAEEEALSIRHALKQQRRLGYFDLHPERKQRYTKEEEEEEQRREQNQHQFPSTESPPKTTTNEPTIAEPIRLYQEQPSFPSPLPDLPRFDSTAEMKRAEQERVSLSRVDSATLPQSRSPQQPNGSGLTVGVTGLETGNGVAAPAVSSSTTHPMGPRAPAGAGAGAGTKTAALIELYRERERRASPKIAVPTASIPLPPPPHAPVPVTPLSVPASLIPGRGASVKASTSPISVKEASLSPSPPQKVSPLVDQLMDLPMITEETGRASPARYIHGAPLHNVLEEEEEE